MGALNTINDPMNPMNPTREFTFKPDAWPANAIHISLDLETASTAHNAAIVQLAAVASTGKHFNSLISLAISEAHGFHVDVETMSWWNKQDPELRNRVFSGKEHPQEVLEQFITWCYELCEGNWDRIYIWGNGVDFDCTILRNAIEMFGTCPFSYRNMEHLRTLKRAIPVYVQEDAHDVFMGKYSGMFQPHDALGDALYQLELILHGTHWLKEQHDPSKIL